MFGSFYLSCLEARDLLCMLFGRLVFSIFAYLFTALDWLRCSLSVIVLID